MHLARLCLLLFAAPLSAQAYLVGNSMLYQIDLGTGAATAIGGVINNGLDWPSDLCWRDDTDELFTVDLVGGEVGTVDPVTAMFTPRWATNMRNPPSIAWDPSTRRFFLFQMPVLYRLDPATGAVTTVGLTAPNVPIMALVVDATGRLFGVDFYGGGIYAIDKNTGAGTLLSVPGFRLGLQGLAIDANGVWYAVSALGSAGALYRIDPATGSATWLGPATGAQYPRGLAIRYTAVQRGGTACPAGNGIARAMTWSGGSNLGNVLQLGIEAGSMPTIAFLLFGFSAERAGSLPLPLDMGPAGAPGCNLYCSVDVTAGPTLAGTLTSVRMPVLPPLAGLVFYCQGVPFDIGPTPNALGLAFSDVARVVVTF